MGKSSESCEHVEQFSAGDFDDSIEETKPSRAVWLITFTVAMGGFLFGKSLPPIPPTNHISNQAQVMIPVSSRPSWSPLATISAMNCLPTSRSSSHP